MQYFLNDTVTGPYSGNQFGRKGDVVTVISNHGNVCIVERDGVRFTVLTEKLSQKEVQQDPAIEQRVDERPTYFKTSKPGKKTVTNPQNNIQSLF